MKRFLSKPYVFAALFSCVLILWVLYVTFDTFIIPHEYEALTPAPDNTETDAEHVNAVITDTSYYDGDIEVNIIIDREYDTDIYVADIKITDPKYLRTAFAEDKCGTHITELISSISERKGAIVTINGDYYGFRERGIVLRNGTLYRSSSNGREALIITDDGRFNYVYEDYADAVGLANTGAEQIFSFGPVLVRDGMMDVDEDAEIIMDGYHEWNSNPRTAIGLVEPGHYMFLVSDGRTEQSAGLSLYQLGHYMKKLGCREVYNLDGGGSSEMWFNGKVLNNPTGDGKTIGERKVSDVVYIGR